MPQPWVTFDCFGTLVDWNTGFDKLLLPIYSTSRAAVVGAYHEFERVLEREKPHRLYRDVLTGSLMRAGGRIGGGAPFFESDGRRLVENWGTLPVFSDVEPMLDALRAMDCKIAILTNCDVALFAETQKAFRKPFDLVVTAEEVQSYKPAFEHFRKFADLTGVTKSDWVHVACSWYHDIAPAREYGVKRIWLDRDRTGDDPGAASARTESAADVPKLVRELLG